MFSRRRQNAVVAALSVVVITVSGCTININTSSGADQPSAVASATPATPDVPASTPEAASTAPSERCDWSPTGSCYTNPMWCYEDGHPWKAYIPVALGLDCPPGYGRAWQRPTPTTK